MKFTTFLITAAITTFLGDLLIARDLEWKASRMRSMDSISSYSVEEQIVKLGNMVGPISTNGVMDDEQREVFERARSILISIPGHAEYYAKQIELKRVPVEAEEKGNVISGENRIYLSSWNSYDEYRKDAFQILRQLSTPETVRVVCGMLNDERDYQDTSNRLVIRDNVRKFGTNAEGAAGVLSRLGVAEKGAVRSGEKPVYRPPEFWRPWHERLKVGAMTYHFPGDPTEYDLNGPASAQKLQQIARADKRDAERIAGHKRESPEASAPAAEASGGSSFSIAAILSAVMAAAGGIWYFLEKKNAAV